MARQIVEGHGGGISAHSDGPCSGSRFEIRLPLIAAPEAEGDPGRDQAAGEQRARRVLVVDDHRDAAEALALLPAVLPSSTTAPTSGAPLTGRPEAV